MFRKIFVLTMVSALASISLAGQIRFDNTGRGGQVDYVFKGVAKSGFAGELMFKDLATNNNLSLMCADIDHQIGGGQSYDTIVKHTLNLAGGIKDAGTVYARSINSVVDNNTGAALQIAVWARVYGTNLATNSGGDFQLDSGWLANNQSIYAQAVTFFNSKNQGSKDALYYEPNPKDAGQAQLGAVPEPASMLALGVGIAAFARKRRQVK